jgi:hypothetical protein
MKTLPPILAPLALLLAVNCPNAQLSGPLSGTLGPGTFYRNTLLI